MLHHKVMPCTEGIPDASTSSRDDSTQEDTTNDARPSGTQGYSSCGSSSGRNNAPGESGHGPMQTPSGTAAYGEYAGKRKRFRGAVEGKERADRAKEAEERRKSDWGKWDDERKRQEVEAEDQPVEEIKKRDAEIE